MKREEIIAMAREAGFELADNATDEALILMLVERLERADKISGYPNNKVAIKAARARLEQP